MSQEHAKLSPKYRAITPKLSIAACWNSNAEAGHSSRAEPDRTRNKPVSCAVYDQNVNNPLWLEWAQRLQAIAQTGLTYCRNPFDTERYEAVRQIAADMLANCAGLTDASAVVDLFKGEVGYATPKVDVRAAVFDQARLLLVREREDGCWTLPGGWADVGSSPSLNVIREVREESGYDVEVVKLAAVFDRNLHGHPAIPFHAYKLFFIARLIGGSASHGAETDGVGFFRESDIPPLSLTRITPGQIRHMFDHYRHPEWATSFD